MEQQNNNAKTEKLTDKAFYRLVITSILGIVVCIFCLCSTTWAWFADKAPSNANEIKTAKECLLSIAVYDGADTNREAPLALDDEGDVELVGLKEYRVVLTLPKDSASGYCIITAGENTYYSDYIVSHTDEQPREVEFTVISNKDQTVRLVSHWGIYTRDSDVKNGMLAVNG